MNRRRTLYMLAALGVMALMVAFGLTATRAATPSQTKPPVDAKQGKPQVSTTLGDKIAIPAPPAAPNVTLYDQYDNIAGTGTSSQDFETSLDAYDDQTADDFVVPAGQNWQVNEVDTPVATSTALDRLFP
jgi:hypothetical protein